MMGMLVVRAGPLLAWNANFLAVPLYPTQAFGALNPALEGCGPVDRGARNLRIFRSSARLPLTHVIGARLRNGVFRRCDPSAGPRIVEACGGAVFIDRKQRLACREDDVR